MFYSHTGHPVSWAPAQPRIYALFCTQNDCFLYVNHDLDIVRSVQTLLVSKLPTWIYELWIPGEPVPVTIDNSCCERWTLPVQADRPNAEQYHFEYSQSTRIDCTNINVLGQISGIDLKDPGEILADSTKIRNWACFLGHMVMKLKMIERVEDVIISRIMLSYDLNDRSDLLRDDTYITVSDIYKILYLNDDMTSAIEQIRLLTLKRRLTSITKLNCILDIVS